MVTGDDSSHFSVCLYIFGASIYRTDRRSVHYAGAVVLKICITSNCIIVVYILFVSL